jgi:hypothetical protein
LPSAYNPTYTFTSPVGGGGLFTFTGLPPGAWTVTAKIGGQTATSVSVTLVAGTSGDTGGGSRTSINLPAGP